MRIKYTVEVEDIVAFNQFHSENSPAIRRTILMYIWGLPIIMFIAFMLLSMHKSSIGLFVGGTAATIGYYFYVKSAYKRKQKKMIRDMLSEGKNHGMLGDHEIILDEAALTCKTQGGKMETNYSAINKVIIVKDYLFIYLTSVSCLVVPRDKITEGNLEEFMNNLNSKVPSHGN